ncbi:hypothetical protein C8J56DRAFT_1059580 [Mycena floridula]|nr:hypothetical protein C8J56DRAFT_1059580 [Mycena floridula]
MPEEYKLHGYLRPLVFEELQELRWNNEEGLFQFPSSFPEQTRRLYSYLLELETSEPDWCKWIHALRAVGCPPHWTRRKWLDAWQALGSPPDWTTRVMIRFPRDIQYVQGGFCATVHFCFAAYDAFHDVIFLHPVSVLIEQEPVTVQYDIDGIEVTMSFPEGEEEW